MKQIEMKNWSVSARMIGLSLFFAVLVCGVGGVGFWGVWGSSKSGETIFKKHGAVKASAATIRAEFLTLQRCEKDMLLEAEDPQKAAAYQERFDRSAQSLRGELERLDALLDDAEEVKAVQSMRKDLRAYEKAVDVVYGQILAGKLVGPTEARRAMAVHKSHAQRVEQASDALFSSALDRIKSAEGERSNEVVRLGTFVGIFGLFALVLGLVVRRTIDAKIADQILETTRVLERVAGGDLDHFAPLEGHDEIGRMNAALNQTISNTRQTWNKIEESKVSRRLVMDNANQGLLALDREGVVVGEHSAMLEEWFGAPKKGEAFWDLAGRLCGDFGRRFRDGWADGASSASLPVSLLADERSFSFYYQWFDEVSSDDDARGSCLVVITETTAALESVRFQEEAREAAALFRNLLRDQEGVLMSLSAADLQVERIELAMDMGLLVREICGLESRMEVMGAFGIAGQCRALEKMVAESGQKPFEEVRGLRASLEAFKERVFAFLEEDDGEPRVAVGEEEWTQVTRDLLRGCPREEIAAQMLSWRLEPVSLMLERLRQSVQCMARRSSKGDVEVTCVDCGVRLDREEWGAFFGSLVHVLGNALEHGFEAPKVRLEGGKPEVGKLVLKTEVDARFFRVVVADDGAGIDWEGVREAACEANLPAETRQDLVEALFIDGVRVGGALSSRPWGGVGLGEVWSACAARGGEVEVESTRGEGSVFTFRFPRFRGQVLERRGAMRAHG